MAFTFSATHQYPVLVNLDRSCNVLEHQYNCILLPRQMGIVFKQIILINYSINIYEHIEQWIVSNNLIWDTWSRGLVAFGILFLEILVLICLSLHFGTWIYFVVQSFNRFYGELRQSIDASWQGTLKCIFLEQLCLTLTDKPLLHRQDSEDVYL